MELLRPCLPARNRFSISSEADFREEMLGEVAKKLMDERVLNELTEDEPNGSISDAGELIDEGWPKLDIRRLNSRRSAHDMLGIVLKLSCVAGAGKEWQTGFSGFIRADVVESVVSRKGSLG